MSAYRTFAVADLSTLAFQSQEVVPLGSTMRQLSVRELTSGAPVFVRFGNQADPIPVFQGDIFELDPSDENFGKGLTVVVGAAIAAQKLTLLIVF